MSKKCGYKEICFERGDCWGHLEFEMCAHLGEVEDERGHIRVCEKDNQELDTYTRSGDDCVWPR